VRKRRRRLDGIDEIVLSLTARGLTTGVIAAHFEYLVTRSLDPTDAVDARAERLRDHLRRPYRSQQRQLAINAGYTVDRTDPAASSLGGTTQASADVHSVSCR
jgi:hypothetical protein